MFWILTEKHGWCGPYAHHAVMPHVRLLHGLAVAGDAADELDALIAWAEDIEPDIIGIEFDPPVGMHIQPDLRLTVKGGEKKAVAFSLYAWHRRPTKAEGYMLAAVVAYWLRGGGA
jgi:hypothetical protein